MKTNTAVPMERSYNQPNKQSKRFRPVDPWNCGAGHWNCRAIDIKIYLEEVVYRKWLLIVGSYRKTEITYSTLNYRKIPRALIKKKKLSGAITYTNERALKYLFGVIKSPILITPNRLQLILMTELWGVGIPIPQITGGSRGLGGGAWAPNEIFWKLQGFMYNILNLVG